MKIGIALTGISYNDQVVPGTNWGRKRSYRDSIGAHHEFIVDPLRASGNTVDHYLYTYNNGIDPEYLIYEYNAYKYADRSYEGSDMSNTFLEGLRLLRGQDIDIVIATRFDIAFKLNPLLSFDFKFSKFNFLFHEKGWREHNFTTDTFYVFPYNMLESVINGLTYMIEFPPPPKNIGMHNLYNALVKFIPETDINIACGDEEHLSHSNDIFTLTREE